MRTDETPPPEAQAPGPKKERGTGAVFVAAGIFASKVMGLVRQRVFAHYLGASMAAAAFTAALRIPNFLQNLFGEGVLSASFIPVYAALIGKGDREEADRVAGAVFGLLALVTGVLVAVGMLATPLMIDVIALGLEGEARALTIRLVRILFPGTGMLVLSAWCLGILNSHRKFFLSYAAPVLWHVSMIAVLFSFGGRRSQEVLAEYVAYGTVLGSVLQFAVQLPNVLRLLGRFRPSLSIASVQVRQVLQRFLPVVGSRGVVQVSAFIDTAYSSLITVRAMAMLGYAQTLYLIPVSLFGMAISAAELPAMAQTTGTDEEVAAKLRKRIASALERIAFFVIPSSVAFLILGDVVGGALNQTGRFHAGDTRYLWYLLMGSAVGLLASTSGRLYASTFYALNDTRTPLRFAIVRVLITAATGYYSVRVLPAQLGVPVEMAAIGITAMSGFAAWVEYSLLRRALARRIGDVGLPGVTLVKLWGAAVCSGAIGLLIKWQLSRHFGAAPRAIEEWGGWVLPAPAMRAELSAVVILVPYGVAYFLITYLLGAPQAKSVVGRILRRR